MAQVVVVEDESDKLLFGLQLFDLGFQYLPGKDWMLGGLLYLGAELVDELYVDKHQVEMALFDEFGVEFEL